MRNIYLCFCFITGLGNVMAQMPADGIMMPQGQICILGQYTNSKWDQYWEADVNRSNANLGAMTTQSAMLMANYGITDNLNVLAGAPYVWTKSSASYLAGQKGIQDLSIFLKYQIIEKRFWKGLFKIQTTGGLSTPLSNYTGDFLPFSIGLHCQTASFRGILNYTSDPGIYLTAQAGHTWRSWIELDRDSYIFDNQLVYSNEMPVPNVFDYSVRLGFIKKRFQTEIWYDAFSGLSGDDIRYNEAPQASNKMEASQVGWFGKGFITPKWALQVSVAQVLSGRNVGEAFTWSVGSTYLLDICKKANKAE